VWKNKAQADRFARELRTRLRDSSWYVHEFDSSNEDTGPLVPLVILSVPTSTGTLFELEPASMDRIMQHFPNAAIRGAYEFSADERDDYERKHGSVWGWLIQYLTGLSATEINRLDGVRILDDEEDKLLHERLP
jgi:hypothetical protein